MEAMFKNFLGMLYNPDKAGAHAVSFYLFLLVGEQKKNVFLKKTRLIVLEKQNIFICVFLKTKKNIR